MKIWRHNQLNLRCCLAVLAVGIYIDLDTVSQVILKTILYTYIYHAYTSRRTGNRAHKTHVFLRNGDFTTVPCWFDDWKSWKNLGRVFWLFSVIAVNDPRVNDHVATFNVVNDPSDLSRVEIFHVRSTRNVNMPPHPTPPHPTPPHTKQQYAKK